jgi:signal peptidase
VGTVLFAAVLLLTLPLAAPRLLGYDVFDVLSGSMEPELPVGSAVYVRAVEPTEVDVDEVIAFYNSEGNVVVHRVVTNRTSLGEFVTKGDANNVEDREPIPYDALLGRVMLHIPVVGRFMALYSSNVGKVYLLLTAACGVMLNMLAGRIRASRKAREINVALHMVRADAPRAGASASSTGAGAGASGSGASGTGAANAIAAAARSDALQHQPEALNMPDTSLLLTVLGELYQIHLPRAIALWGKAVSSRTSCKTNLHLII